MGNLQQHSLQDDLSIDDYRYIMRQTGLTPHVIQGWYREFINVCPSGQLSKPEFIRFYTQLESSSTRHIEHIAENVFEAFDENGNQRIDFKEFLIAYAITSIGDPAAKLQYAFLLFDTNHSKTIESAEMKELLKKLVTLTGNKMQAESIECLARDIFHSLDLNDDQSLSKEEFINGCLKSDFIRHMLSPFEQQYPPKPDH